MACAGPTISTRVAPPHALFATESAPHLRLTLDEVAREVVVDLGPFDVPATEPGSASSHGHGDVAGASSLGVPMAEGQQLALYASWHNDTGHDLGPVYVRVAMDYTSREVDADVTDVLPAYFDTDYVVGGDNTWDVPPGRSERAWDFTVPVSGGLLGVTGRLHDFGHHVRLEDAETGEVLVRLDGQRDEEGRLLSVETRFFRKWVGLRSDPLRLVAGHRYRVVGVYDNPGDETIADGAMAHIVGVFATATTRIIIGDPERGSESARLTRWLHPGRHLA
jgi:hypothetical protein